MDYFSSTTQKRVLLLGLQAPKTRTDEYVTLQLLERLIAVDRREHEVIAACPLFPGKVPIIEEIERLRLVYPSAAPSKKDDIKQRALRLKHASALCPRQDATLATLYETMF